MTRESRDPLQQRLDLSMVDHIGKRVTQFLAAIAQNRQLSPQRRRDWLADELPEDGSQFRLAVERQPVIDAPDLAGRVSQTVANLPVGVVDDVSNRTIRSMAGSRLLQKSWRSWRSPSGCT